MFKITVKAKTYAELQTKLMQIIGVEEVPSAYDTTEEDKILEDAYVNAKPEEPEQKEEESFEMAPSATDGIGVGYSKSETVEASDDERDSKGMPYSAKIHSATKAKNKDGSWRYKRGVDDAKIKEVEATLVGAPVQPMPGIPPVPTSDVVVPFPVAPQAAPQQQAPVETPPPPVAPVAPSVHDPVAPPVTSTKPAHTVESFAANFYPTIASLVQTKAIDQNYLEGIKKHFGATELWDIAGKPEQVKEMFESLVSYGLITKVG